METIKRLKLQTTKIVPIIEFMDHYAFDDNYLVMEYMSNLSDAMQIKGHKPLAYDNEALVNSGTKRIAQDFAIVADIAVEKLPTLLQLVDAYQDFEVQKELGKRIKEALALLPATDEPFDAGNLNHDMANWDDLWIVTYVWLLVSINLGNSLQMLTESDAMERVFLRTVDELVSDDEGECSHCGYECVGECLE